MAKQATWPRFTASLGLQVLCPAARINIGKVPFPCAGPSAHAPNPLLPGSASPQGSARTLTLWSLEQVAIRRPWKSKETSWMRSLWSAAMLRATNMASAGHAPLPSAPPASEDGGRGRAWTAVPPDPDSGTCTSRTACAPPGPPLVPSCPA